MYAPSRDQARQFLFDTWRKYRAGEALSPLERIALDVVLLHPEYHPVLDDAPRHAERDFSPDSGQTNPFLHIHLHLAIEEQLSIDQPPGIRAAFDRLATARGDRHAALHDTMECLGEMVWAAQRNGTPPDGAGYVECVRRKT